MADTAAAVQAANTGITDAENLFNDVATQGEQMLNNFAGQAANMGAQMAGMAGGAPAGRLQQDLATATNEAVADTTEVTQDATALATDATQVVADMAGQFMNTANNFMGNAMGGAPAGRLQQNAAQDIGQLNQDAMATLSAGEGAVNDFTEQTEDLMNNAVEAAENAFGLQGATVENPTRVQQDPNAIATDTTAVLNDAATATNDMIAAANDMVQQGVQAFSGMMGGAAASPATRRRLQRMNNGSLIRQ